MDTPEEIKNLHLHGEFVKSSSGKYSAVLSDDSIDRENEIVSKQFLETAGMAKIVGLIDHKNSVLGQVCEWQNKRIVEVDGHNALIAEPKWFMSNPNAGILKGMLDEGADIGISIGAIPKKSDIYKINGKEYKRWLEGDIVEASFVAIPANKHARITAIAKMLKLEETKMDETQPIQKEVKPTEEKQAPQPEEKFVRISESDLNKLIDDRVKKAFADQPVLKMQADQCDLKNNKEIKIQKTPSELADEALKKGILPIRR